MIYSMQYFGQKIVKDTCYRQLSMLYQGLPNYSKASHIYHNLNGVAKFINTVASSGRPRQPLILTCTYISICLQKLL